MAHRAAHPGLLGGSGPRGFAGLCGGQPGTGAGGRAAGTRWPQVAAAERQRKIMSEKIDKLAGKPAPESILVNVPRLVAAYYTEVPDPGVAAQRVAFGTSGHRGSAFDVAFNEAHILAISEAICRYRKSKDIDGPLYLGMD